jgi:hypothetical protein
VGGEDLGDDLFSTKGWRHQISGSAYGGDGDAIYVPMKLAGCSGKLIFDKQDRFVHPAAIARMTEEEKIHHITFPKSS